ncbi:MAG TPA: tryptophan--tRNA ligase, partial [archaeon]|nr:tryptophan--tRNA ligase [archaeon]
KPLKPLLPRIPDATHFHRREIIFGHRDFERILDAIRSRKSYAMLTGLMPSGKFHLGHATVAKQFLYYQDHGAQIAICVADLEAHATRGLSLAECRTMAVEEYLTNYIALGLKPKGVDFYFQSARSADPVRSNAYYRLIGELARRPTMNEMTAVYGELTPGKIMSALTQAADILHLQLPEFGGPKPIVVPVGADQDPHLRLTRDLASRMSQYRFVPPSATFNKFMPGLKGGKMSSSDPLSYIALTDSPEQAADKIRKHAFSGGKGNLADHRKFGGDPEVDVAFQMLRFLLEPDDKKLAKIEADYRSGKLLTGDLKSYCIDKLSAFLKDVQRKRPAARKQVEKFLKA